MIVFQLNTTNTGGVAKDADYLPLTGEMHAFVKKLEEMGYEKVDLIDTTNGKWIRKSEAGWMGLSGSALLTGRK